MISTPDQISQGLRMSLSHKHRLQKTMMQLEMYSTLARSKLNPSEPRADAEHYSMKAQRDKTGDQSISLRVTAN